LIMFLTNNESIQEVLFFPQMKPQVRAAQEIELNEDEKMVFEILQKAETLPLEELKTQSGLSNKKWDKTIKGLTGKKVAVVEKEGDDLVVKLA
ncbi:MAG: lysine--tRNA ligase, partial [Bacteroidota bacterium]|nr:lysine--tRNA ligase [Bacteroidota bacterium]